MTSIETSVFPIPGRIEVGVPMEETVLPSKTEAEEFLKQHPAFAASEEEAAELAWSTPEATPADDSNVKKPRDPDEPAPEPEPTTVEDVTAEVLPEEGGEASNTQAERDSIPSEED